MMKHTLALLLLAAHSPAADAAGPSEPRQRKALSPAERISRPVSESNPFGLDYGFHPVIYITSGQGVPTHQMSMLNAQIAFAEAHCTTTSKPTRHQRVLHFNFVNAHDKDLDQPYKAAYAQAVGRMQANYQNAWNDMNEPQRSEYCAAYWNDVRYFSEVKLKVRVHLLQTIPMFYLGALSPLSNESIEEIERKAKDKKERDRILGPILLLGQALSLAGGISAGNDALAAQKSGDYSIAQMRYAQSRSLLRISGDIGTTAQALPNMDSPTAPSQQPPQASCQTLDYFDRYDADPDSDVWKMYQSLTAGCDALNSMLVK